MKKTILALMMLSLSGLSFAGGRQDSKERLTNAGLVLSEIMSAPDKGIPQEVIDHASCIAVIKARSTCSLISSRLAETPLPQRVP